MHCFLFGRNKNRYNAPVMNRLLILASLASLLSFSCVTHNKKAIAPVQSTFEIRDLDRDGHLTHHEIASHSHNTVLREHDTDQDGHLSQGEWDAIPHTHEDPDTHFNHIDKNDNGMIEPDEAIKFVTDHVHYTKAFEVVDENDSNSVSEKELYAKEPSMLYLTVLSLPL